MKTSAVAAVWPPPAWMVTISALTPAPPQHENAGFHTDSTAHLRISGGYHDSRGWLAAMAASQRAQGASDTGAERIQTPRIDFDLREKECACRSRKDGVIQRCFDSKPGGHADCERQDQQAAEEGCDPGAVAQDERDAKDNFTESCNPSDRRNPTRRKPGVELGGIDQEIVEVSPRHQRSAGASPDSKPVTHSGEERRAQSEPEVDRGVARPFPDFHLATRRNDEAWRREANGPANHHVSAGGLKPRASGLRARLMNNPGEILLGLRRTQPGTAQEEFKAP